MLRNLWIRSVECLVYPHPRLVDGGVIPKDFHLERASSRVAPQLHTLNNKQLYLQHFYIKMCVMQGNMNFK